MSNLNKVMRDPVAYRCNLTPHWRTGAQLCCKVRMLKKALPQPAAAMLQALAQAPSSAVAVLLHALQGMSQGCPAAAGKEVFRILVLSSAAPALARAALSKGLSYSSLPLRLPQLTS